MEIIVSIRDLRTFLAIAESGVFHNRPLREHRANDGFCEVRFSTDSVAKLFLGH